MQHDAEDHRSGRSLDESEPRDLARKMSRKPRAAAVFRLEPGLRVFDSVRLQRAECGA